MFFPSDIFPVMGVRLTEHNAKKINLTSSNPKLSIKATKEVLHAYIFERTKNYQLWGYGGYLEKRSIYEKLPLFNDKGKFRNIHLGVDIWAEAYCPIYLPYEGTIYGQDVHEDYGGYGGIIIVEHKIKNRSFYSLYGHLSHDSIGMYDEGEFVEKGEVLGHLGEEAENGHWSPHLHLQFILDMGNHRRDYPGVCLEEEKAFYAANCPNPEPFYT